jgi:hypothetical protein
MGNDGCGTAPEAGEEDLAGAVDNGAMEAIP